MCYENALQAPLAVPRARRTQTLTLGTSVPSSSWREGRGFRQDNEAEAAYARREFFVQVVGRNWTGPGVAVLTLAISLHRAQGEPVDTDAIVAFPTCRRSMNAFAENGGTRLERTLFGCCESQGLLVCVQGWSRCTLGGTALAQSERTAWWGWLGGRYTRHAEGQSWTVYPRTKPSSQSNEVPSPILILGRLKPATPSRAHPDPSEVGHSTRPGTRKLFNARASANQRHLPRHRKLMHVIAWQKEN